jgi:hypothetical protein
MPADGSKECLNISNAISDHKKEVTDYVLHDQELTVNVSKHLLMRHVQLHLVEELTKSHDIHKTLLNEFEKRSCVDTVNKQKFTSFRPVFVRIGHKCRRRHRTPARCFRLGAEQKKIFAVNSGQVTAENKLHPDERAYRLAVTDLFVEKAQAFLDERAQSYQRSGKIARRVASAIVVTGAILAWCQFIGNHENIAKTWLEFTIIFARAFTAYGMIVLAAVGFWKYSKAMLDQAERLYERRHSLRQGRLFVHLNDGKLNVEEMEKAFRWHESQENAFSNLNTDASAPWGALAKDLVKTFPELYKTTLQSTGRSKSEDK